MALPPIALSRARLLLALGVLMIGLLGATEAQGHHASASSGGRVLSGVDYAWFTLRGSHGFKILVAKAVGGFGVRLTASRRHTAVEYETFDVANRTGREGIEAEFGGRGRVRVTFHPIRTGPRPSAIAGLRPNCKDVGGSKDLVGIFTGKIEFRGERGYTRVRVRRARGHAGTTRVRCTNPEPLDPTMPGPQVISASRESEFTAGSDALRTIRSLDGPDLVSALQLGDLGSDGVPFAAKVREERRLMTIKRVAVARGPAGSLTLGPESRAVTASPPWPFSGAATLSVCGDRAPRGTIEVALPGRTTDVVRPRFGGFAYLIPPPPCQ